MRKELPAEREIPRCFSYEPGGHEPANWIIPTNDGKSRARLILREPASMADATVVKMSGRFSPRSLVVGYVLVNLIPGFEKTSTILCKVLFACVMFSRVDSIDGGEHNVRWKCHFAKKAKENPGNSHIHGIPDLSREWLGGTVCSPHVCVTISETNTSGPGAPWRRGGLQYGLMSAARWR